MVQFRKPEYLSPSALFCWRKDKEEYYRRYLSENKIPRLRQTEAMSVGGAFDCWTKSAILARYGLLPMEDTDSVNEKIEQHAEAGIMACVEEYNREFAQRAGKDCYDQYSRSGFLALLRVLDEARTIQTESTGRATIDGVPLLGKPDLVFITKNGRTCVLDWKVNGWCGQSVVRPKSGHINGRGVDTFHEDGIGYYATIKDKEWYDQLAIYGLVCGEASVFGWIEQLCCQSGRVLEVGRHIGVVDCTAIVGELKELWSVVLDPTTAYSSEQIRKLESQCVAMSGSSDQDRWFQNMMGR